MPQNSAGCSAATFGPGTMPWMIIAPTISAMTGLAGMPSVSSGMKRGLRAGIVGRFRPGHAGDRALAEFLGRLARCASRPCRRRRRPGSRRRPAGCRAPSRSPCRAASAPTIAFRSSRDGQQAAELGAQHRAVLLALEVAQDFGDAEDAHRERHEVQPVGIFRDAEGEARRAGIDVGADEAEQQAEHHHGQRLEDASRAPARWPRRGRAPSARNTPPRRTSAR